MMPPVESELQTLVPPPQGRHTPMSSLSELQGTRWTGTAELWLDPLGDDVIRSDCTIAVGPCVVRYTWSHEGREHQGSITLRDAAADFTDTRHQPEPMRCRPVADALGLFQVQAEYGPDMDWRWRIGLSLRTPTDELVLQMTNVAPWERRCGPSG
ncbi:MAG: hypothetical protein MZV65_17265 [Chromatiales bacterium]|nr:hypothetical protein [Chromatiales bacterium]